MTIPFNFDQLITAINSTENLTGVLEKDESFEIFDSALATPVLASLTGLIQMFRGVSPLH